MINNTHYNLSSFYYPLNPIMSQAPVSVPPGQLLTPEQNTRNFATWMQKCPNPEVFAGHMVNLFWLSSRRSCYSCEDSYTCSELRYDESYWSSGELICKGCWFAYDEGTIFALDYKAPPWPEKLTQGNFKPKLKGVIRDRTTNKVIGTVTDYRRSIHYGRVARYGFENESEYGSLDPDDVVTDIENMTEEEDGASSNHAHFNSTLNFAMCFQNCPLPQ